MSKLVLETLERMRALAQMVRSGSIDGQAFHIEQPMQVHFHELKRIIVESTLLQMEMLAAIEVGEASREIDGPPPPGKPLTYPGDLELVPGSEHLFRRKQ